jgi:hypothetical protein
LDCVEIRVMLDPLDPLDLLDLPGLRVVLDLVDLRENLAKREI